MRASARWQRAGRRRRAGRTSVGSHDSWASPWLKTRAYLNPAAHFAGPPSSRRTAPAKPGSGFERQPDVVLGQRRRGRLGVHQVVELGVLDPLAERSRLGKLVHERGEPPREAFGAPDAAQAPFGVAVEAGGGLLAAELG